jgi:hypothetical protein
MPETTTSTIQKATIVPLHYCGFDLKRDAEYHIFEGVSIRSSEEILSADNFKLWREYLSERERDGLAKVRLGLVNNFQSGGESSAGRCDTCADH